MYYNRSVDTINHIQPFSWQLKCQKRSLDPRGLLACLQGASSLSSANFFVIVWMSKMKLKYWIRYLVIGFPYPSIINVMWWTHLTKHLTNLNQLISHNENNGSSLHRCKSQSYTSQVHLKKGFPQNHLGS